MVFVSYLTKELNMEKHIGYEIKTLDNLIERRLISEAKQKK